MSKRILEIPIMLIFAVANQIMNMNVLSVVYGCHKRANLGNHHGAISLVLQFPADFKVSKLIKSYIYIFKIIS